MADEDRARQPITDRARSKTNSKTKKKQRMGLRVIYITQSALLNVNLTTLCALQ